MHHLTQGMQYTYMSAMLSTLERKFGIKSKETVGPDLWVICIMTTSGLPHVWKRNRTNSVPVLHAHHGQGTVVSTDPSYLTISGEKEASLVWYRPFHYKVDN